MRRGVEMFFKYRMHIKRNTFVVVSSLCIGFFYTNFCFYGDAQTLETPSFQEAIIRVKAEDIDSAVIKEKEMKAEADKAVDETKSFLKDLAQEAQTITISRERLKQEKKELQKRTGNQTYSELLDREIDAMKEKITIDNEQIEAYEDMIAVLQDQSKAYSDQITYLLLIFTLDDEIAVTPYHTISLIQKEIDTAKDQIVEIQDGVKEKALVVSFFTNRLKEITEQAFVDNDNLAKDLKSEREGTGDNEQRKILQDKMESILKWKRAVNEQRITLFKTRLETSKIRYSVGLQTWKNAELHAAFLAEKARRFEEKQKEGKLNK